MNRIANDSLGEVQVERSNRKTVVFQVNTDGTVVIKIPFHLSDGDLEQLIKEKQPWIEKKMEEMRAREGLRISHTYQDGDVFYFLGVPYTLKICVEDRYRNEVVELEGQQMRLYTPVNEPEKNRKKLEKWYRTKAEQILPERVAEYQPCFEERVSAIKIKAPNKRWGSCTQDGELSFNYRLVMAPYEIIDYVVVHEMCHLKHMNHSRLFKQSVGMVLPDYKRRKDWLQKHAPLLEL